MNINEYMNLKEGDIIYHYTYTNNEINQYIILKCSIQCNEFETSNLTINKITGNFKINFNPYNINRNNMSVYFINIRDCINAIVHSWYYKSIFNQYNQKTFKEKYGKLYPECFI